MKGWIMSLNRTLANINQDRYFCVFSQSIVVSSECTRWTGFLNCSLYGAQEFFFVNKCIAYQRVLWGIFETYLGLRSIVSLNCVFCVEDFGFYLRPVKHGQATLCTAVRYLHFTTSCLPKNMNCDHNIHNIQLVFIIMIYIVIHVKKVKYNVTFTICIYDIPRSTRIRMHQ